MTIEELRKDIERIPILDAFVDDVDSNGALAFVDRCIRGKAQAACILAVNPEKIYALRKNSALRQFFCSAGLLVPDGIGVVAAARLLDGRRMRRTPGADLMQQICAVAPARGYRLFVLGASERVNVAAVVELHRRYPGINIVGRANGFFDPDEDERLMSQISASRAEILFVALGSPRQEMWIQQHLPKLTVAVIQGVGGTLDTIAGTVRRAPRWTRAIGLEWLYRFVVQPSRARRQVNLVRFAVEILSIKFFRERA
jgi:N-acetylglucosaminyldiphosphoundecaprenol N-acetyl-beta-D-mannosaminyltransferase